MNPNAGEPVNPGATTVTDNPVSVASSPDVARVEGLVAAAQKESAAQTTPEAQFENQFGSPPQATTPPVADNPTVGPGLIDTALASLGTPPPAADASTPQPSADNLVPEQTQPVVETLAQPEPEQTPAEKLKKQIADSVNAFLEEVAGEKTTA